MKNLRKVIRELILESTGISSYEVRGERSKEDKKRFSGQYAKKLFAQKADREFLDSLTYITTLKQDGIDAWLSQKNSKDELSCIAIEGTIWQSGEMEIPHNMHKMFIGRVGFVIKGWVTWLQNKNASSGHTGSLLKGKHKGVRPPSGVNKAPGMMHRSLPSHQLSGVIMDQDDMDNFELFNPPADAPNQNNEALLDNWEITGVVVIEGDPDGVFDESYISLADEALAKVQKKFPKAKLIRSYVD